MTKITTSGTQDHTAVPARGIAHAPTSACASDRLMKIADVIAYTRLSKRKIQNDMRGGALAFIKFGRSTRFDPHDVQSYIDARRIARRGHH